MSSLDKFDRLLDALPKIAEAVNSFDSEEVQRNAFDALVGALGVSSGVASNGGGSGRKSDPPADVPSVGGGKGAPEEPASQDDESQGVGAPTRRPGRRGNGSRRTFTVHKDINFAPVGKQSLEEFVSEKAPRSQHEKNLAACYYLSEVLETPEITLGHVLAVYQAAGWNFPAHPDTALQNTASARSWLDTSNMKDIKVVWAGQNYVRSKMPSHGPNKKP